MKKNCKLLLLSILSLLTLQAQQQQPADTIGEYTFELIQKYKPEIEPAAKITPRPELKPVKPKPIQPNYISDFPKPDLPQPAQPLPPPLYSEPIQQHPRPKHILSLWAGYPTWGELSTYLSKQYQNSNFLTYGTLLYRQTSQWGNLHEFKANLKALGKITHSPNFTYLPELTISAANYNYPQLTGDTTIPGYDTILNLNKPINKLKLGISINTTANLKVNSDTIELLAGTSFLSFTNLTQWTLKLKAGGEKKLWNKHHIGGLSASINMLSNGGFKREEPYLVTFRAYYRYLARSGFLLHLGIKPAIGKKLYLLPDIYSQHWLLKPWISYFTEFTGYVNLLPLEYILRENPFPPDNLHLKTEDALISRAGLRLHFFDETTLELAVTYKRVRNFRMWIIKTAPVLSWVPLYDKKAEILSAHASITQRINTALIASIKLEIFDYRLSTTPLTIPFHYPRWEVKAVLLWRPLKTAYLYTEALMLGNRTLYLQNDREVREPLAAAINIEAGYRINKVSLKLKAMNLPAGNYYLLYPYRSWGVFILAGISIYLN